MKKYLLSLAMIICYTTITYAQDDLTETEEEQTSALTFSGSVDAYYRSNFGGDFNAAPGTSFANLPGFALGMANLVASQEGKNFGFTADLVFGPRGEDATFLSGTLRPADLLGGTSNSSSILNQLYAYWNVSDAFTLTLGNFNTFLGYEVISPTGNFNYSTSYMFSYGPFSHTGLKADITLSEGFTLMAGVFNPTDATEYNPTNDYAGGLQLGYESGGLGVWLNGLFSDGFSQFDITAGYDLSETIYVGLNATTASDSFTGIAGYFQVAASDALKLGLRAESFTDKGAVYKAEDATEDVNIFNFTVSANYTVGSLTIIPEFRIDSFSEPVIPDGTDITDGLSSFVLAAVYGF